MVHWLWSISKQQGKC